MTRFAAGLVGLVLAATAAQAGAQTVYKWVDERGQVNYSNEPPKDRAATPLAPESSRLTVVPGLPNVPPTAAKPATGSDPALRSRVEQLERENDQGRAAAAEQARRDAELLVQWRERCRVERWTDCDDDRALFARYGSGASVPAYGYVVPRQTAPVRPIRPVQPTTPRQPEPRLTEDSYPRPAQPRR